MNKPTSVKLELTEKELGLMVYMLGAITAQTDEETFKMAYELRKKLSNAQKVFSKKPERPKDKYGKHLSDEEIDKALEVAQKFADPQPKELTPPQNS